MSAESTKEGTTVDNDLAKESSSDDSYNHYWFDVTLPPQVNVGQEFSIRLINYDNMKFTVRCPEQAGGGDTIHCRIPPQLGERVLKLNAQGIIPSSQDLGMDISVGGDETEWTNDDEPALGVITDTLPDSLIVIPETQQTLLESSVIPETLPESIVPETLPESIVPESLRGPIVVCVPLSP